MLMPKRVKYRRVPVSYTHLAGAVLREEAEHLLSAASAAAARVKAVGDKNAEA